jgi:hypothetical protein
LLISPNNESGLALLESAVLVGLVDIHPHAVEEAGLDHSRVISVNLDPRAHLPVALQVVPLGLAEQSAHGMSFEVTMPFWWLWKLSAVYFLGLGYAPIEGSLAEDPG